MAGVNAVQKLTPKHFLVVHLDHNFYLWYPGVVGGLFHSWISHFISIVETFKYVCHFLSPQLLPMKTGMDRALFMIPVLISACVCRCKNCK